MGYKNRTEQEINLCNNSSSSSEALLFATMCIIGLPVDVYVKDGSVYSGIFHTASVEKDYDIVLKKAKMTKKGKGNANVANGAVIEALVILSADLVQVVAKGIQLPADGIASNFAGDDVEDVVGTVPSTDGQISEARRRIRSGMNKRHNQKRISICNENGYLHGDGPKKAEKEREGKILSLNNIRNVIEVEQEKRDGIDVEKIEVSDDSVNGRQVGEERPQGERDSCTLTFELHREENADGVQGSRSDLDACQGQVILAEEVHRNMTFKHPNGVSHAPAHEFDKPENQCCEGPTSTDTSSLGAARSSVSTSSNPVTDATLESFGSSSAASTEVLPPQSLQTNKSSNKSSKLNPGAKIFTPSFANPISATPPAVPTVANMAYMPSNSPVLPLSASQSEVGISPCVPRSSVPAKFVPYGNMTAGNGGGAVQFSQLMVGHAGSRTQPVRYAGQYPVQAGPAYVHPNSQAVVVGRLGGQLLYMQPVSNDLVQGVAAVAPVSARPALTPHQVQFPKHQGSATGQALQLCVPSPLVGSGLQPFPVPSHISVLQPPIPANRPIPDPGSNGLYSTKFP